MFRVLYFKDRIYFRIRVISVSMLHNKYQKDSALDYILLNLNFYIVDIIGVFTFS